MNLWNWLKEAIDGIYVITPVQSCNSCKLRTIAILFCSNNSSIFFITYSDIQPQVTDIRSVGDNKVLQMGNYI